MGIFKSDTRLAQTTLDRIPGANNAEEKRKFDLETEVSEAGTNVRDTKLDQNQVAAQEAARLKNGRDPKVVKQAVKAEIEKDKEIITRIKAADMRRSEWDSSIKKDTNLWDFGRSTSDPVSSEPVIKNLEKHIEADQKILDRI